MYAFTLHLANGVDPASVVHRILDRGALNPVIVGDTIEAFAEEADFANISKYAEWASSKASPPIRDFTYMKGCRDNVVLTPATPRTIREQLDKAKFQILAPEKFTDRQLDILLRARANPDDSLLKRVMPITIARFEDAAQEIAMRLARRQPAEMSHTEFRKAYIEDVQALNLAFFGVPVRTWETVAEIKLFTYSQTPELHTDETGIPCPVYIARIGSLPAEAVRARRLKRLSPEDAHHIARAKIGDQNSLDYLRSRKILTPLPLNKVIMMIGARATQGDIGTLHCSSPVPREGAYSGFFRTFGSFQKRPTAG